MLAAFAPFRPAPADVPDPIDPTPPYAPTRTEQADVRIDGALDEALWQRVAPLTSLYQQRPDEGAAVSQQTELWLAYDQSAIYLAARLYEEHPASITSRTLERDSYDDTQDGIALILDTFNDDRTAFGFIVTPAGVRTDLAVYNDAESGAEPWNLDWDTYWESATLHDESGWTAEIRIPFSSLRFGVDDEGSAEMGFIVWRYLARHLEFDVYPPIPNNWNLSAYKPSQAQQIRFERIHTRNPLYVKPYTLGGLEQSSRLNDPARRFDRHDRMVRDLGLDLKYNVTSNLILDVTVNTDFAQVEADDEQINLTRFSLFLPEKRDFFQERADLFTYRFPGGDDRIFQSRRIGIEEGQPVPILGGVRLTGNVGAWELGVLQMQTGEATLDEGDVPSENFGVLRLLRPVLTQGSYVGGMVTSRTDLDGHYNLVYAVDADLNLGGPNFLKLELGQSREPGVAPDKSLVATVTAQRRIRRGFSYGLSASHYGSGFNPALGFLRRNGVIRYGQRLRYTWFPASGSKLQNHGFTNRSEVVGGNGFDRLETITSSIAWEALFRSGLKTMWMIEYAYEALKEAFELDDLVIVPDTYSFLVGSMESSTSTGRPLMLESKAAAGGYYGGWQAGGELGPTWTPGPHFSIGVRYGYNHVSALGGTFDAHVARVRLAGALNRQLSGSAYVQFNSNESLVTTNVRIRYNPAEGNDLYIVYNEGLNTRYDLLDPLGPRLPRLNTRTLLVKYTYTFAL